MVSVVIKISPEYNYPYLVLNHMKRWITQYPLFPWLLCLFFVLHGFTANFDFVPVKDSFLLVLMYCGFTLAFILLFWLLFRNFTKSGIAAFLIMAFHFFFGATYDTLEKLLPGTFISTYKFILPAAFIVFATLIILLKRRKTGLQQLRFYLNTLFLILILIDLVSLTTKLIGERDGGGRLAEGMAKCDTCSKPDIYFILADEYAGNKALFDKFNFDNSAFTQALSERGFHTLPASYSNYNYTPFSVASILNMNYLNLQGKERAKPDLTYSYEVIRDNQLLPFLLEHGYQFYNHSIFDFTGQPARTREGFLASKTRLITSQTLLSRLDRDIRFNLVTRWKSKKHERIVIYAYKKNNEHLYKQTWKLAELKSNQPRFVYTHIETPHFPYYFDKDGNERPYDSLGDGSQVDKKAYIGYLQYGNKKLLELVDHIKSASAKPPIIIIMGDHGFRHFTEQMENQYYFLNHCSVYFPSQNYSGLSDSLTGVNFFRAVLNSQFSQRLPYLPDQTIYLKD